MATAKKTLTAEELVETHKPKNFKYKYIFNDDSLIAELMQNNYDMSTLDTICNDDLVEKALSADFTMYERTIIGKAKEPSIIDEGIIISKKMVTKADKKLLGVYVGFFEYQSKYIAIKLHYERFDIIEIFNLL